MHYDGSYASALSMVSHLEERPPIVLDIQHEMVDDGYPLLHTAAGRYLDDDFLKRKGELQHQLDEVRIQLTIAQQENENRVFAEDMENQGARIMTRLALGEQGRRRLNFDITAKSNEGNKRIQELAQQTRASPWGGERVRVPRTCRIGCDGEPVSGATMMIKLGLAVLKLIFQTVNDIFS
ncbi:hypothetical protein IMSHALPRED_006373 [Imshaugia aleurites]|uniref:Uncharacterized protein n=1 Tax=Imshaugia aleurites TaxID=172621 RepID=A0A8H3FFH4_9LECA|nr:hypothetical protein IMSHALPRED_006373 [Imshaugia aleurites]